VRALAALLCLLAAPAAFCQIPQQQIEIQRALIQRDQQSADFARRGNDNLNASQLRDAGRPLNPDPAIARELLPYERQQMARDREMFPPLGDKPAAAPKTYQPLPLPGSGGPPEVVMPISTPSIGG
jgi:hypothetical protein